MLKFTLYLGILIGIHVGLTQAKTKKAHLKEVFVQGLNSNQAPILHITTLTLDTVTDVPWGRSINVTGKLTL